MATLKSVSKDILKQLGQTTQVGRAVASDLLTLTRVRIFEDGKNSKGSNIGEYTPATVSIKKSTGRFTSNKVNLRDTGKLANSYILSCKKNKCELGFAAISRGDGKTNDQLVKEIEQKYGAVFALTSAESKEIDNIMEDFMDRIFK